MQVGLSLRSLIFVLILGIVLLTGSDVARGAPSQAELTGYDGVLLTNPGQNGARDVHTQGATNGGIRIYAGDSLGNPPASAALQFYGNGHTAFPGQAFIDSGSHASAAIIFRTAASGGVGERMRITAGGNVGVGTTTPSEKFVVQTGNFKYGLVHTDGNVTMGTFVGGGGFNPAGGWIGTKSNHPLHFFTNDSNVQMSLTTGGNLVLGTLTAQARLTVDGGGAAAAVYGVGGSGSPSTGVQGVNNGASGYGVYGTNTGANGVAVFGFNTGSGGYAGYFTGPVKFAQGQVTDQGGSCVHNCSSDVRLKKDITPLNPVLASLAALEPVEFTWRGDEFPERNFSTERTTGLVAQEVEKVLPDLVFEDDQGYKGVRYERLPLLLLEGEKELKMANDALTEQNVTLQGRVATLEGQNAALEARLAAIEQLLNGSNGPLMAAR